MAFLSRALRPVACKCRVLVRVGATLAPLFSGVDSTIGPDHRTTLDDLLVPCVPICALSTEYFSTMVVFRCYVAAGSASTDGCRREEGRGPERCGGRC